MACGPRFSSLSTSHERRLCATAHVWATDGDVNLTPTHIGTTVFKSTFLPPNPRNKVAVDADIASDERTGLTVRSGMVE